MNKISIVLINCLFMCICAYSQADSVKINQLDSLGNKNGLWVTYYDTVTNISVKEKIYYDRGRKSGVAEFYNIKGELRAMHTYTNDTLNGRMIIYTSDSTQHYYIYSKGEKVWYGVVENGILGYVIIYIDGIPRYNYFQTEDGKFHGIGTSRNK